MLVLPQKSLDQSNDLMDLGRSLSQLLRSEENSSSGWLEKLQSNFLLRWSRPFMRRKIAKLTRQVEKVTPVFEKAEWDGRTAEDYNAIRVYRDNMAGLVRRLNQPEQKKAMKFMEADFNNYLQVSMRQLRAIDALLGKLDSKQKDVLGFSSVDEKDLWENRSKGYDFAI